jgi:hypothetical protein
LLRYVVVTFVGFVAMGVVAATAESVGAPYWLGSLSVVLVVPPVMFLLHSIWTYREYIWHRKFRASGAL